MNDATPGKLITIGGAAVAFLFSFLPWYKAYGYHVSAWGSGLFPMASWSAIFALLVGFAVAVRAFKFLVLPERIWEFTLDQLVVVFSIFSLLITLSYLIVDHPGSISFGLFLCLLGAIAMVAGIFVDRAGIGVNPNATTGFVAGQQPGFTPPTAPAPQPGPAPYGQPPVAQPPASGQPPAAQPPASGQPPVAQPPMGQPSVPQQPVAAPPVTPLPGEPSTGSF